MKLLIKARQTFYIGFAKGFSPSIKPNQIKNAYEAFGYLCGVSAYKRYIDNWNKHLNNSK